MHCPNKSTVDYERLEQFVGEEKAHTYWDASGGEINEKTMTMLINANEENRIADKMGFDDNQKAAYFMNNKDLIYNLDLDSSLMDTTTSNALKLIQSRIDSLSNMHVDKKDKEGRARKDIQIETLKQDYKEILKAGTIATVLNVGNKLMDNVSIDLATSKLVSATDVNQARDTMRVVKLMVDDILKEKKVNESNEIEYVNNNPVLIETANNLRAKLNNIDDLVSKLALTVLNNSTIAKGSRPVLPDDLTASKEAGVLKSNFLFAGTIDNKLIQHAANIMQDMEKNAMFEYTDGADARIDNDVKELKKVGIDMEKKEDQKLLLQEDEKGNFTTNIISKFTFEFDDLLDRTFKALKTGTYVTIKDGKGKDVEVHPFSNLTSIAVIADCTKLFGADATEENIAKERQRIIDELGEEDANELINEAERKYKAWEDRKGIIMDRYIEKHRLKAKGFETEEDLKKMMNEYVINNSPDAYLVPSSDKKGHVGMHGHKYLALAPSKKAGNIYYDKKYESMKSNPALFKFYNTIIDTMREALDVLPEEEVEHLSSNYLPEVDSNLADEILHGGLSKATSALYYKMMKLVSTKGGKEERFYDDGKGNKIPLIPIRGTEDRVNVYRRMMNSLEQQIKKIQYSIDVANSYKSKYPKEADRILIPKQKELEEATKDLEQVKEAYKKAMENKSLDIINGVKKFSMMATIYKHKNAVKDTISLVERIATESYASKRGLTGQEERDEKGNIITTSEKADNSLKSLRYSIEAMLYDKKKADKKATSKFIATSAEGKKNLKAINERLKKAKESLAQGKITLQEYDIIEEGINDDAAKLHGINNLSFGRILDNFTQMAFFRGLSWNIRAAIGNVVIAKIGNSIEAAGGQYMDSKSLKEAEVVMRNAVKNSLGMRNEEAVKIANLMHRYGVMFKNLESAYGGEKNTGEYFKKLGLFAPMELQKRGEYYNQGVTLVSILKFNKVKLKDGSEISLYDAYDNNGVIREDVDNMEQWVAPETALTSNKFTKVRAKVAHVIAKVHGDYENPMRIKKTAVGRAIMGFKTWMPEAFNSRFGEEYYSDLTGEIFKGRYRSYANLYKTRRFMGSLNLMKNIVINNWFKSVSQPNYTGLSNIDIQNLKKNAKEIQYGLGMLALTALAYLAFHDDDDDDKEKRFALNFVLDMVSRAQSDITLFIDPKSMNTTIIAAPPALKWLLDVEKIPHALYNALAKDDKRYGAADVARRLARVLPLASPITGTYDVITKGTKSMSN